MERFEKLPKRAVAVNLISTTIVILILGAIRWGVQMGCRKFGVPERVKIVVFWGTLFIVCLVTVYFLLQAIVGTLRFRYRMTSSAVESYAGIIGRVHEIVPIRKMIQINIEQGILDTVFGLADIEIITAGGKMTWENLLVSEAEKLAEKLTDKINEFEEGEEQDAG